ncbi:MULTISPECIES: hypothetical protein [unclassified Pseudomonas]|uniref:hypothetical protein n=1 Tax=unclassified Pseudomonas TaxID=196821 RepID=UPI00069DCCF0|nr:MULTISPECIES: hypothetical protein [unclassified Pseudomonas]MBY8948712.1 hypothetical protein [Pseudomonas sp. SH10-3B]
MNSEKTPSLQPPHFKIIRQAIVDRGHAWWGSEISVAGGVNLEQLESACTEALRHIHPPRKTLNALHPAKSHTLLRIGQSALMNDDILRAIIQAARALEYHKHPFTLSLDNPLDALPGPVERRAMVRQLYKLKDHSITLAYNNYRLDTKPADLLIDLELYDYIKMPFPDSALRLSLNTRSDLFDRLYDRMLELISVSKVCFIADQVEFADSAMLAKNLPFEYFQGGYYSPADCL